MHQLYADTQQFDGQLEARGYKVRTLWEHDYAKMEHLPEFQEATAHVRPPMRLEDALFGGRVEAFIPQATATDNCEIRYRDVVSKMCLFPCEKLPLMDMLRLLGSMAISDTNNAAHRRCNIRWHTII